MKKYIYQKYLLNCDYQDVDISSLQAYPGDITKILPWGTEYCLFDVGNSIIRKIELEKIDELTELEENWKDFVKSLDDIDILILQESRNCLQNPIIQSYRKATLQAYICRLRDADIQIFYNEVCGNHECAEAVSGEI